MRQLILDRRDWIPEEVFHPMSPGLSYGVLCPGVRNLRWTAVARTVPLHRLLLSQKLTTLWFMYESSSSPEENLSILQQMIMELDTFHLRDLSLQWWSLEETSTRMESAASAAVLRCGPALEELTVSSFLSDAAVQHIMRLPNLRAWDTMNGPPRTLNLSLSDIFPRLDRLSLGEEVSLEWLTFFTTTTRRISSGTSSYIPLKHGPIERLRELEIFPDVIIDGAFMSRINQFRELTSLRLTSACYTMDDCAFNLTDDDIAEIAAALPRLEVAVLGRVCRANSCQTTVASLVSFSTQCRDLNWLEIHFNTTNLRNDLDTISVDPRLDSLPTRRTSNNFRLFLSDAPYKINEDDIAPVVRGFCRIFPSLAELFGNSASWKALNPRLLEA